MDLSDRAQAHSPALVGLLSRLAGVDAPSNTQPVAARLAQWIDWPQAVALASALEPRPAPQGHGPIASALDGTNECVQLRATLVAAIEGDRAFGVSAGDAPSPEAGFFRQRYVGLQQVMEGEVGLVRKRLRDRLAHGVPAMRQLAAVDAVMERALGARERALLAGLPDLLSARFEHLRAAQSAATVDGAPTAPRGSTTFRLDMKALLLAELGLRLQPVQALAAALRDANRIQHD